MEEHINNLKRNIIKVNSCEITVCEEDFNFSDNESDKSFTILKDFPLNNVDNVSQIENDVQAVKNNLKNTITNVSSQSTYCETPKSNVNVNLDENTYYSTPQETLLENYIIINMNKSPLNDLRVSTEFYPYELIDKHTHISQSQENLIISNKCLLSKDESKNGEHCNIIQNTDVKNNKDFSKESHNVNVNREKFEANDKMDAGESNNIMNNNRYSQDLTFSTGICIENPKNSQNSANSDIFTLNLSSNANDNNQNKQSKKLTPFSQNDVFLDEFEYFTDSSQITLNSAQNGKFPKEIEKTYHIEQSEIKDTSHRKRKVSEINLDLNNNLASSRKLKDDSEISGEADREDLKSLKDVTESQVEEVTFKVLEELNKVKNYLNRREKESERWRSSQLDTFIRVSDATSVSVSNVSESAQCLLRHITSSALLSRTAHITSHVSEVLGELINTLHEDEKYPNFLETLLETIDSVLLYVYEGDNCIENIVIKKEQAINRLLLLNNSPHIIEYTIQTITSILRKVIQDFKSEEYEVKFSDKAENLCHILHILEVILKRHTHAHTYTQKYTSQSSQSQELKKSALTELWRRKWRGETGNVVERSGESGERVLKECSRVLRSLLVEGMNGFGLIAFCALNCYNLLQN